MTRGPNMVKYYIAGDRGLVGTWYKKNILMP